MFMYVFLWGVHVHIHVDIWQRLIAVTLLSGSPDHTWSSLCLDWLFSETHRPSCTLLSPPCPVLGSQVHVTKLCFSCGFWEPEHRPACLHGKHLFHQLTHFPRHIEKCPLM